MVHRVCSNTAAPLWSPPSCWSSPHWSPLRLPPVRPPVLQSGNTAAENVLPSPQRLRKLLRKKIDIYYYIIFTKRNNDTILDVHLPAADVSLILSHSLSLSFSSKICAATGQREGVQANSKRLLTYNQRQTRWRLYYYSDSKHYIIIILYYCCRYNYYFRRLLLFITYYYYNAMDVCRFSANRFIQFNI